MNFLANLPGLCTLKDVGARIFIEGRSKAQKQIGEAWKWIWTNEIAKKKLNNKSRMRYTALIYLLYLRGDEAVLLLRINNLSRSSTHANHALCASTRKFEISTK